MDDKITMKHGDGGEATSDLIHNLFYRYFDHPLSTRDVDAAIINNKGGNLAFTTDSFIVKPLFFAGGDIGKLAINGTVNDLVVSFATPKYISCSFIIEEGFSYSNLEQIVKSMSTACKEANVNIVTGDTKVVERGHGDGIYINTSGIGFIAHDSMNKAIENGDSVIVTGSIGDHGTVILMDRYNMNIKSHLESDCAPLTKLLPIINQYKDDIKLMRDPTRGGVATVLNEFVHSQKCSIMIDEEKIPYKEDVKSITSILGLDPLYLPCEGRMILIVKGNVAEDLLERIKQVPDCESSSIIGTCIKNQNQVVSMNTEVGGKRIIPPLENEIIPRIC